MNKLSIDHDGKIHIVVDFDNKSKREIQPTEVLRHLTDTVEWCEDFTLYSYFRMIKNYPLLQEIDPWFKEYIPTFDSVKFQLIDTTDNPDAINYITVSPIVELNEDTLTTEAVSRFTDSLKDDRNKDEFGNIIIEHDRSENDYEEDKHMYFSYHVSGKKSLDDDAITYAIDFIPIRELLGAKIFLDECIVSTRRMSDKHYENNSYRYDSGINLFDLVTSIIYEVSFHGDESDKEERLQSIIDAKDELDRQHEIKNSEDDSDSDSDSVE